VGSQVVRLLIAAGIHSRRITGDCGECWEEAGSWCSSFKPGDGGCAASSKLVFCPIVPRHDRSRYSNQLAISREMTGNSQISRIEGRFPHGIVEKENRELPSGLLVDLVSNSVRGYRDFWFRDRDQIGS
jgi:hypothetical protein